MALFGSKKIVPSKPPEPPVIKDVGWRLGVFVSSTFEPAKTGALTATEIWEDYKRWCVRTQAEPLVMPLFFEGFDELVKAVGIERLQMGGNVVYLHMKPVK